MTPDKGFDFLAGNPIVYGLLTVYGFLFALFLNRVWNMPEKYVMKVDCDIKKKEDRKDKLDLHLKIEKMGENLGNKIDGNFKELMKAFNEHILRGTKREGD